MYYIVKQSSYSTVDRSPVCAVSLQRRWGLKQDKTNGWKNLMFWGPMADAMYRALLPGKIIDISGGGIMRFPKPRKKRGGNSYGN